MKTRFAILSVLIYCTAFAQTKQDQRVWFAYIGQYKVSEKWGYHIEAQFRMDNQLEQNLQNLYRIGGMYFLSPRAHLTAGYALVKTYNSSLGEFYSENRLWEQYQFNKKWADNKNIMTHRVRLEQRWVEHLSTVAGESNSTNFQSRLRYLNRNLFHLANLSSEKEELYAVVQDEIFLNTGNNKVNSKFFDQNRLSVGLGLNYNNSIRLELAYMNQFLTSSSGNNAMNHVVSVSLLQNLDLQKH
ncbi:MAG: DUF2490 domain-containing protein [Flavobacterium sp.]